MNTRIFARVTLAAAAGQAGMVIAGHVSSAVASGFAFGGLVISMLAGVFYARLARGGWSDSLLGGLLAGGACAFLGIGASMLLGDVLPLPLAFGTAGSAVAGLIGGAAGKLTAPRP